MSVHLSSAEVAAMRSDVDNVELAMTCTIERLSDTGQTDSYGNPVMAWQTLAADVPCWYWEESESEIVGPTVNATVTSSRVKFEAPRDITAGDRITSLADLDGTTHGPFEVRAVVARLASVVATVEAIS